MTLGQNPASREPRDALIFKREKRRRNPAKFEQDPRPEGSVRIPRVLRSSRNPYPHPQPLSRGTNSHYHANIALQRGFPHYLPCK